MLAPDTISIVRDNAIIATATMMITVLVSVPLIVLNILIPPVFLSNANL